MTDVGEQMTENIEVGPPWRDLIGLEYLILNDLNEINDKITR
jgi:hypothetical protein